MDYFLNFKNKSYEAQYYEPIEPYLSKIVRSDIVIVLVMVPVLPYTYYWQFHSGTSTVEENIVRTVTGSVIFVFMGLVGLFIHKNWDHLRRHPKASRWSFDILLVLIAGYFAYQFFYFTKDHDSSMFQYIYGWLQGFLCVVTFSPISRWYLKLFAYLIVILRVGIGCYLLSYSHLLLIKMFQMVLLEILITYFNEKDRRKYFIEKQQLYEETKVYKEIFDLTSDGVIIYGLQEGTLYRNWSNEKHRWWDIDESIEQNFEKISLKGYKKISQLSADMEVDLKSLVQSANKMNFREFLKQLTQQLIQNLQNKTNTSTSSGSIELSTNPLKPGRLMLVTGAVERPQEHVLPDSNFASSNTTYILEIKVMYTVFKEKPSIVLLFSDITERSLVTILQENNNYKTRLLASVSHELRTPLNASINFTQEAIDHPDLSELSEVKDNYLFPALRSNQLLLNLINDILDFSQMSENKLRLVFEKKNVHETLDECLNLIKIQANRKGLKVFADYKPWEGQNELFCTDHNRLKQIVLNLMSNALKFTLVGEIRITAEFATLTSSPLFSPGVIDIDRSPGNFNIALPKKEQRILRVSISDTGIGISEENKAKLFKAFEKIDLGEKSVLNAQGVGLGLVISNNLVVALGPGDLSNKIKVESEVNKGTTFTFWILDHPPDCPDNRERSNTSARSEDLCSDMKERLNSSSEYENMETLHSLFPRKTLISLNSEKKGTQRLNQFKTPRIRVDEEPALPKASQILIVDDDIFNICALRMILSKLGYTCDVAYNGEQAIQKVLQRHLETLREDSSKQNQYKVIFMDCNMPIMDGFEATRILKAKMKDKEIEPIVIVACTAFIAEQDKVHATGIGVDGFCIKPVSREKIGDILKRYLPMKKTGRESNISIKIPDS